MGKEVLIERFHGRGRPAGRLLSVCGWVAPTFATFNSRVFSSWPLQILLHSSTILLILWKAAQKSRPKRNLLRGQGKSAGWSRERGWECLLADGKPHSILGVWIRIKVIIFPAAARSGSSALGYRCRTMPPSPGCDSHIHICPQSVWLSRGSRVKINHVNKLQ